MSGKIDNIWSKGTEMQRHPGDKIRGRDRIDLRKSCVHGRMKRKDSGVGKRRLNAADRL